jgi:hypothetical protein
MIPATDSQICFRADIWPRNLAICNDAVSKAADESRFALMVLLRPLTANIRLGKTPLSPN